MELGAGEDLAARLARGPLPVEDALSIARQIAEALEEAHRKGVVHRDLKPANVTVSEDGKVKVLDFGLAKLLKKEAQPAASLTSSQAPTVAPLTTAGAILGTVAYLSPEQARGKVVDERTDIWAFGALLFELLTGKRAFAGETASDTLASVLTAEPDWSALPAATPPAAVRLLRRCLVRDPHHRLQSIGDARIELEHAHEQEPATSASRPGR